jgi:hypothetical protein
VPVSAAAVHDVVAECPFQKAAAFFDDSRQPGNAIERGALRRQLVGANFRRIGEAFLFEEKVIAAGCGDEQEGLPIGFTASDEVLRIVINVDGPEPDGSEEAFLIVGKVGGVISISIAI